MTLNTSKIIHVRPTAIAKVRYRKSLRDGFRTIKLKLKLTLFLTLTDTGGAVLVIMLGYRSLYITWQYSDFCESGPLR